MSSRKEAPLDDPTWIRVEDAANRLEECWRTTSGADLAQFLPPPGDPGRATVLIELVKIDQEHRFRADQPKLIEVYLKEWPELKDSADAVAELLEAECLTRAGVGAAPDREEIAARFPDMSARIDLPKILAEAERERRRAGETPKETKETPQPQEATRAPTPWNPERVPARFQIRGVLGRGGMGTVYRAYDTQLEREVALKVPTLDPEADRGVRERFIRESKVVARISHPNICQVFDAGHADGCYYIVMALIEGESLSKRVQRGPLDCRQAAEWACKLARALAEVHAAGVIHRDLKPHNVMIDSRGEPLLTDFGLARPVQCASLVTGTHSLLGTPAYMSPEQVHGEAASVASDVYGLGVVLYQALTGKMPFHGPPAQLLAAIARGNPLRPSRLRPTVGPVLERICLKAMARRPADRFSSASEMADALQQCLDGKPWKERGRRRTALLAALAAALALLLIVVVAIIGRGLRKNAPADILVEEEHQAAEPPEGPKWTLQPPFDPATQDAVVYHGTGSHGGQGAQVAEAYQGKVVYTLSRSAGPLSTKVLALEPETGASAQLLSEMDGQFVAIKKMGRSLYVSHDSGKLWKCDGNAPPKLIAAPFDRKSRVTAMAEFGGAMHFGTADGRVLSSANGVDLTAPATLIDNRTITDMAAWKGKLYACNAEGDSLSSKIFSTDDGKDWPASGSFKLWSFHAFVATPDHLYVASRERNQRGGFAIYRTADGTEWTPITDRTLAETGPEGRPVLFSQNRTGYFAAALPVPQLTPVHDGKAGKPIPTKQVFSSLVELDGRLFGIADTSSGKQPKHVVCRLGKYAGGPPAPAREARAEHRDAVAYFPFDEGEGDAANEHRGRHKATVRGAAWGSPEESRAGKSCLVFGATGEVAELPPAVLSVQGAGTFMCWAYAEGPRFHSGESTGNSCYYLISMEDQKTGRALFDVWLNPDGEVQSNLGGVTVSTSSSRLQPNRWTHVAIAWSAGKKGLYLDGRFDSEAKCDNFWAGPSLLLGGCVTHPGDRLIGRIDEAAFYDRCLSAEEIAVRAAR